MSARTALDARPLTGRASAFRRLCQVWGAAMFGEGVRAVALPLYVAVWSHDPLAVAAVTSAEALPWLIGALPAGALVDRLRVRSVLVRAHALRAVLTAALVVSLAAGAHSLPVLCLFAFLLTTLELFADPASQVLLVRLVAPDELQRANSRFFSINTVAVNLLGPLAGSALFTLGPLWAFAANAVTFAVAALLATTLPATESSARATAVTSRALLSDMAGGARLLLSDRRLRALILMVGVGSAATAAVATLLPLYAVDRLALPPSTVGYLVAVFGAAALLGALLAARLPAAVGGAAMTAGMAALGAGFTMVGLFPRLPVLWAGCAVAGLGLGVWNVLCSSLRQRLTPADAMGRVSGVYRTMSWGLTPLGSALAGVLAAATSVRVPLVAAGVATLTALAVLTPSLRPRRRTSR